MRAQEEPPTETVTVSDARQRLGQLLNQVYRGETRLVIEKSGIPVAAIISPQELQRFNRYEAERADRFKVLDSIGAAFVDVSEAELEEEIGKALADVRDEQRVRYVASPTA